MIDVTNMSTNPLVLSDGKSLAPGASRKFKTVGDREKRFESRGWLRVIEENEEPKSAKKTEAENK